MGKTGVHASNFIDMTGWKMWEHGVPDSRVIVISQEPKTKSKKIFWKCKCSCGSDKIFVVDGVCLRSGNTLSCGCIKKERHPKTHGGSHSKLYYVWQAMIKRCENQNSKDYSRYGGRGISVCYEWHSYEAFEQWAKANGYQQGLELDRENNDGDYCPENCRWATHQEQCCNRSSNVWIEYNGKKWTAAECAQTTGVPYVAVLARVKNGWTAEEIFSVPYKMKRKVMKV